MITGFVYVLQGKSSCGSITSSSACAPSLSPSTYSIQNPGFTSIISEGNESYHNLSSPSFIDVSSEIVFKNNVMHHSGSVCQEPRNSHNLEVSEALKRLEEQLSLNDDTSNELEPFAVGDENSNSTGFLDYETEMFTKGQYENLMDKPAYSVKYQFPDERNGLQDNLSNYVAHQDVGMIFPFLFFSLSAFWIVDKLKLENLLLQLPRVIQGKNVLPHGYLW